MAPILFCQRPRLIGPIQQACFDSPLGPARVALAAHLVRSVAAAADWPPPFRVGLAWAGAPGPGDLGTISARYGPAIPDLVARLSALIPLENSPCLHSDARAALEGAAVQHNFSSAYALISGSGLGESYYADGHSWSREQFQARLGRACDWLYQGQDGESWLRAEAWRNQDGEACVGALKALVSERLSLVQPEVIVLGGHFKSWFENGWVSEELARQWWSCRLLPITVESALLGCVQMEQRRLTLLASS